MLLTPTAEPRKRKYFTDMPECCQKKDITQVWERYDLRITTCNICGRVYRRFYAEPGSLGAFL